MAAAGSFVVVAVVVAAAFSLLSAFWGQNLAIWPICLHPQHLGRLLSTTTNICRSPLINVSGMALKPFLCQAQPEGIIPVGCPDRGSEEIKFFYLAIGT